MHAPDARHGGKEGVGGQLALRGQPVGQGVHIEDQCNFDGGDGGGGAYFSPAFLRGTCYVGSRSELAHGGRFMPLQGCEVENRNGLRPHDPCHADSEMGMVLRR